MERTRVARDCHFRRILAVVLAAAAAVGDFVGGLAGSLAVDLEVTGIEEVVGVFGIEAVSLGGRGS